MTNTDMPPVRNSKTPSWTLFPTLVSLSLSLSLLARRVDDESSSCTTVSLVHKDIARHGSVQLRGITRPARRLFLGPPQPRLSRERARTLSLSRRLSFSLSLSLSLHVPQSRRVVDSSLKKKEGCIEPIKLLLTLSSCHLTRNTPTLRINNLLPLPSSI